VKAFNNINYSTFGPCRARGRGRPAPPLPDAPATTTSGKPKKQAARACSRSPAARYDSVDVGPLTRKLRSQVGHSGLLRALRAAT